MPAVPSDWPLPPDTLPENVVAHFESLARRVETPLGDGALVWRIFGADSGKPPVVLTHGFFGAWNHWIRNLPTLMPHYTVICVDTPGMGESALAPGEFSAENLGACISEGLSEVLPPPAPFDLVGFSFGGILGGQVAKRQGERVKSFTICGSGGMLLSRDPIDGMKRLSRDMSPPEIAEVHRHNLGCFMFGRRENIDDLAVYMQTVNVRRQRNPRSSIHLSDVLARALPDLKGTLRGIWGRLDAATGRHAEERRDFFRTLQPGAPFAIIDGAGHWVMYEGGDDFNRTLLSMLQGTWRETETA